MVTGRRRGMLRGGWRQGTGGGGGAGGASNGWPSSITGSTTGVVGRGLPGPTGGGSAGHFRQATKATVRITAPRAAPAISRRRSSGVVGLIGCGPAVCGIGVGAGRAASRGRAVGIGVSHAARRRLAVEAAPARVGGVLGPAPPCDAGLRRGNSSADGGSIGAAVHGASAAATSAASWQR